MNHSLGYRSFRPSEPYKSEHYKSEPYKDKWLKLILGYIFLQSVALTAFMSSSRGDDQQDVFSSRESAGRFERSLPEVREVENRAEFQPHLGVMAGYQNLNGPVGGNVAATIDVGVQPVVPFGLGLQFQYSPGEVDLGPTTANFDTTNLLAKGTYNFGGDITVLRHSYVGAKTGLVWYGRENDTTTHFAIGPTLGVDFPIDETLRFTIGPEISLLGVIGEDTPDQFSASGAMKYWF